MRLLGIDYGTKRIGLAMSDDSGRFAMPHSILESNFLKTIRTLIDNYNITTIVMGDPRNIKGWENPLRRDVLTFKKALEDTLGVTVILQDETLTSAEVRRSHKAPAPRNVATPHRSGKEGVYIDDSSAALILQRYINAHETHDILGG